MIQTGQPPASASLVPGRQVCGCSPVFWVLRPSSLGRQQALDPRCASPSECIRRNISSLPPPPPPVVPRSLRVLRPSLEPRVLQASPALCPLPLPQQPPISAIASLCPPSPPAFRVLGSDEAPVLGRTWGCAPFTPDTHLLSSVRACPSVPSCCPVTRLLGPGLLRAWI